MVVLELSILNHDGHFMEIILSWGKFQLSREKRVITVHHAISRFLRQMTSFLKGKYSAITVYHAFSRFWINVKIS